MKKRTKSWEDIIRDLGDGELKALKKAVSLLKDGDRGEAAKELNEISCPGPCEDCILGTEEEGCLDLMIQDGEGMHYVIEELQKRLGESEVKVTWI